MINCVITSPKKTTVYKNVRSIMLPAFSGQMQILSGHAESFILLQKGDISLRQLNKQSEIIQIMNGECYIKNDVVTIIL
jgi:F0F1-type ATP synthase epsilon subunit